MREWTRAEIQRIGYQVVDLIADHLTRLPDEPVFRPVPPDLQDQFQSTPPPVAGATADDILREVRRQLRSAREERLPLGVW